MDRETTSCPDSKSPHGGDFGAKGARPHGLRGAELEGWNDRFLSAGENGVRRRPQDEEAL